MTVETVVTATVVPLQNVPRRKDRKRARQITRRLVTAATKARPMVGALTEVLYAEVRNGVQDGLPASYRFAHRRWNRNSAALFWDTTQVQALQADGDVIGGHIWLHGPVWFGIVSRARYATWRKFQVIETGEVFTAIAYHPSPTGTRRGKPAAKAAGNAQTTAEKVINHFIRSRPEPVLVLGDGNTVDAPGFGDFSVTAKRDPIILARFADGRTRRWSRKVENRTTDQAGSDHRRLDIIRAIIKSVARG